MFKSRDIQNHSHIGNVLKDARQKTGLSLKMAAKHVKINKKYLEALENNRWQSLPGRIYAKKFLKRYCQFLGLDFDKIWVDFTKISYFKNKKYQENFKKKTSKKDFLNLPKIFQTALIVLAVLTIISYLSWQINQIIKPPKIILFYPATDLAVHENTLIISGKTEPEVRLKINGQDVILEADNTFSQTLNLQAGLNIIKIEGKKKYSKTKIIERKIIVE